MIKVEVSKNKEEIDSITFKGHANYEEYGKDIVCSGASSIVTTTINGILSFDKNYLSYEEKKDYLKIKVLVHNEVVDTLLCNMMNMLREIENDYPKNLKIKEEN